MTNYQKTLLIGLALIAVLSCFRPLYPEQMFLQHFPTVFFLITLPALSRRFPLSNAAITCFIAFMLCHVVGARYIYSYVPYDEWSRALFGTAISDAFNLRRNHYDRVVHFFFGALWVLPVSEIVERYFRVPRKFALYTAVEFVLAFSMLYELFEWGLTLVLSPEDAGEYNGQQGDIWDAQKDMSFAFLGSLLSVVVIAAHRLTRRAPAG